MVSQHRRLATVPLDPPYRPSYSLSMASNGFKASGGGKPLPLVSRRPGDVPPPHNPEAEAGVLGAILLDSSAMADAVENVRVDDFYDPAHQKIMSAMLELFEKDAAIDVITVSDVLRNRGELESVGGVVFITSLESQAKASASVEYYATIIRDKAAIRRMINTASAIVSEGYSSEYEPGDFLDRAEQAVFAVGDERLRSKEKRLDKVLADAVRRIEMQVARSESVTGIATGYSGLDRLLLGFQPSDLVVIAARPSMGKTSFALNLAVNASCLGTNRKAILFCSLEMSEPQVANRILCIYKRIDSGRIRRGFLGSEELDQLRAARDDLADRLLFIDDTAKLNVLELRAKARRMKARGELDMIMVDYLQLMDPVDKRVSREQQISEISRSLKALAKELDIPVIALSQLSRAPEARPKKERRPLLSDLRESGAIEQDADLVMFLYRAEYYEKEQTKPEDQGVMEVIVAKQRNGPTGTVRLLFIPDTMVVSNIAVPVEPGP